MEKNSKNMRGITLIALIITIIVMLILVAVSISIALNTGLFESAGKATGDWDAAQEQEQELASGKVNIGGVWYNSIDEYVNEKPKVDISNIRVGDYISNYPVTYTNVGSKYDEGNIPSSEYNGWRILSIENQGENMYVKLISAGIPMSSYIPYDDGLGCERYIKRLTDNYLTTDFSFSETGLQRAGFNMGEDTTLENVFKNQYTNKVQSLTKEDIDELMGNEITSETDLSSTEYGDLLAIPRADDSTLFVQYWLATQYNFLSAWYINSECTVSYGDDLVRGVRPVVTMVPNVKFTQSNEKINNTATWEISL